MARKSKLAVSRALSTVRKYFPNVTRVNDAKAGISVEVTRADERASQRKSHETCAMAVACKRTMKLDGVIISIKTAYMIRGTTATRFKVPERVSREVVSFDRGAGFEPGNYRLEKPIMPLGSVGNKGTNTPGQSGRHISHVLTKNIRTVLGSDVER